MFFQTHKTERQEKKRFTPQFNVQCKNRQFKDVGLAETSATLVSDSTKQRAHVDVTCLFSSSRTQLIYATELFLAPALRDSVDV